MEHLLAIPADNIFENDQLNREPYIKGLMNVLEYSNEHKVIAINAPWGTGKTTLIRLWEKYLDRNYCNFSHVTFNAWENDDAADAILSLAHIIAEQLGTEERKNSLREIGKELFTLGLKIVSRNALDLSNFDLTDETTDDISAAFEKISGNLYDSFTEQQTVKELFKETLEKLCDGQKLIIFIDELDRCRPTFAIETLERIKHFFDIPNCFFVLAVDREQLGHSIKTIYGNDMDTTGYLRRFFDIEINLCNLSIEQYFDFRFSDLENENYKHLLLQLVQKNNFSLRDIDKLYQLSKIVVPQLKLVEIGDYNLSLAKLSPYCSFMVCKIKYPELYQAILSKNYVIDMNFSKKIDKIIIPNQYISNEDIEDNEIEIDYHGIIYNILNYYLYDEKDNSDRTRWEVTVRSFHHHKYDIRNYFNQSTGECHIFKTLEMFQLIS